MIRYMYQILSNVGIFTEGFDIPLVDAIIMARPTKSLGLYLQMAGRGIRPKPDGGDCLILDHAGNVLRHGMLDDEHYWTLESRKIQEVDHEKKEEESSDEEEERSREYICASCGYIFTGQSLCPACGTPLPKFAQDVETARGELIELPGSKKPAKKQATKEEKQRWWSMFMTYGMEKGYKSGWAAHKYKEKFGVWPRGLENRRFHGPMYPNEFHNYLKYLRIKHAKTRHNHNNAGVYQ